ncbi:zinc finger protein 628 isoform X5 [Sebastes umbrosus]|uniref:zinc finger protein 628 isoform X5 n=1 Tax=Sebastes umbrosus TaxID=72105 RepID=UPI00189F72CF|nr:zinc finger protein 628 isoform X5 [Sebastes umbrosus]
MCKTVKTFKKLKCLLTFGPSAVSASQTAHQAEPARSHLRHLQQGVQEQLQPAAAPVGAHGHQDEGPRGAGEGGRSEGRTGGEADGPSVPPPPHPADATSSSSTPSDRHRRRRCRPGVPAPPAPPARSAARQPREPAGLRVHRHGNCNYGCTASTHPGSCCCRGLHGAGGFAGVQGESESPPQHQPGEEEPRLRGVREGLQRRLPPQPPPSVPLGREAVLLPHLPAALQEERPHELPRALAPRRRGETLRLSSLRQGLLSTGPPQQPRPTGALYRETVQVHGNVFICLFTGVQPIWTCTSAFATRDRLRAHLVRHEEKVPCHICGKLLSAAYITDHMRVHNQSQHHACHLCNRSFTTLTYLRVHAQKHHGQEWKESGGARGGFGGTGAGGVLLCQLCGVQCKTATQLQGHMGTHANQVDPGPDPTTAGPVGTTSVAVTVSSASAVGLLVTDCSGIAPQPHS